MSRVGVQLIYGSNPEPFLESALRSVAWADYVVAINTDPHGPIGDANERVVVSTVPAEKLRRWSIDFVGEPFDFASARNLALRCADDGDYVLIVDSDEVYYPEFEAEARRLIAAGHDTITSHYFHLAVYKDLLHSERHREILYRKTPEVRWERGVHELLIHPRENPALALGHHCCHLGYIKPAREVAARWEFYRALGSEVHDYDVSQPDRALDDWPRVCTPFWAEHPPAVRELLKSYPAAPKQLVDRSCRIGLVMLTWNDAENLRKCLVSLQTTSESFELIVVDNGSEDATMSLVHEFAGDSTTGVVSDCRPGLSLAQALNVGFGHFLGREDIDYIGWIHPDMVFERHDWLERLRQALDEHPRIAKAGAAELGGGIPPEPGPGNTQCYLIRRTALERVGLFDEGYLGCGGREDWDMNIRLTTVGSVLIWPEALIRHNAMGTRKHHDTNADGVANANHYFSKWGRWDEFIP